MISLDLSFDDYLRNPAYGSSDLKTFRAGPPSMVPWRRANRTDETPAMAFGTACHSALLTPDLFAAQYVARPAGIDFRTKDGKAWRDSVLETGKQILDGYAEVQAVVAAVRAKKVVADALRGGMVEVSLFWDAEGLPCKGRPDFLDGPYVYDLKVSIAADKEPNRMMRHCYDFGWLHQLAHNAAGLENHGKRIRGGRLVIVSPNAPHNVQLVALSENDLGFLEMHNQDTRAQMLKCHQSGIWPGTPDDFQTYELPASAAFTESDLQGAIEL